MTEWICFGVFESKDGYRFPQRQRLLLSNVQFAFQLCHLDGKSTGLLGLSVTSAQAVRKKGPELVEQEKDVEIQIRDILSWYVLVLDGVLFEG